MYSKVVLTYPQMWKTPQKRNSGGLGIVVDTSVGSKNVWIFVSFAFQELSFDKELESFRNFEVHFQIQPILVNSGGLRMNIEYVWGKKSSHIP